MKVFVYGTLKKGFGNHVLLSESQCLGPDSLKNYSMFSLGYFPAIRKGEGTVYGEVYEVTPEQLQRLDRLEGHPTFYERIPVVTNGNQEVQVYVMEKVVGQPIPSGVWQ